MLAQRAIDTQPDDTSFELWQVGREEQSATAKFWFSTIKLETLLFMFVRSLRESNFDLFIPCLEEMLPWMCALDHTNYARFVASVSG